MYDNLVLGGGGITGLLYVGLFKALRDKQLLDKITSMSTQSVGAGIAFLYLAMGKDVDKMEDYLMDVDFRDIFIKDPFKKPFDYGVLDSDRFKELGKDVLKKQNLSSNITFQELYDLTGVEFNVLTTNISSGLSRYFSHTTDPNAKVLTILQMSMAIPYVFTPVKYDGSWYIDGGYGGEDLKKVFRGQESDTLVASLSTEKDHTDYFRSINNFFDFAYNMNELMQRGTDLSVYDVRFPTVYLTTDIEYCFDCFFRIDFLTKSDRKKLIDKSYRLSAKFLDA